MRPSSISAVVTRVAGVLLLALLLASCSDVGSGDGTRPSISPTRTPTAELPTDGSTEEPTEPTGEPTEEPTTEPTTELTEPTEPTGEPTEEPTTEPTEEPTTEPPTTEPSTETPSPTRTPTRTEQSETTPPSGTTPTEPEQSETASETVSESPEAQEPEAEPDEEGVPAWVWWLVAALVLGSLVAIPLVLRSRRRSAWDQQLAAEEAEVAWLARELLPELGRAASREELAGGWTVSQARVSATEDRLTVLESSAPDEPRRTRARVVRDASRAARAQMQRLLGPGPHDTWALDLDAIIIDLEAALRPAPAPATAPPDTR